MKKRLITTAVIGAALSLGTLAAAIPAHAGTERSDGLNECMEGAEGGCSNGPFDGMGAGGTPMSSQEKYDAAVTFLASWKVGLVLPASDGYIRYIKRPYGTSIAWEATQAYAEAYDTVMSNPPGSTRCGQMNGEEMLCQSPN